MHAEKRIGITIGTMLHQNAPLKEAHIVENEESECEEEKPKVDEIMVGPIVP